ncbi:hypothetical protein KC19_12G026100 [Ceratodon purpureus]|uniref:Uncharacterized protein n=1 Tax=Ceratodon purpureus TaxID=3225 RepID=A0A8T0G6A9_CERPU|nr:hypothetical protein KC19_12G026100 [Ceratodon purpureus]
MAISYHAVVICMFCHELYAQIVGIEQMMLSWCYYASCDMRGFYFSPRKREGLGVSDLRLGNSLSI